MNERIREHLRRLARWLIRTQRYRYLRAQLWEEAVCEMECGSCA